MYDTVVHIVHKPVVRQFQLTKNVLMLHYRRNLITLTYIFSFRARIAFLDEGNTMCTARSRTTSTFQSHEPEFDYLKSLEIEEKINKIRWLKRKNQAHFLLSTNGMAIFYFYKNLTPDVGTIIYSDCLIHTLFHCKL
jgi:hypothetical protein